MYGKMPCAAIYKEWGYCERASPESKDRSVNFWNGRRFLIVVG